jgi:hypothetical protein
MAMSAELVCRWVTAAVELDKAARAHGEKFHHTFYAHARRQSENAGILANIMSLKF